MTRRPRHETLRPTEFIEINGPSLEEANNIIWDSYFELKNDVYSTINIEDSVVLLIVYTYVIYHLISKLRGNERNVHMNTFGVVLALLMFLY